MTQHKLLLLRLINAKADVGPLLAEGLMYSQISEILGQLIDDGLVVLADGAPTITERGLTALRQDDETGRHRRDGGFIGPLDAARIDRLAVDAVYLPALRNSFF